MLAGGGSKEKTAPRGCGARSVGCAAAHPRCRRHGRAPIADRIAAGEMRKIARSGAVAARPPPALL